VYIPFLEGNHMNPIVLLLAVGMFGWPIYKLHLKSKAKHGDKAYAWTAGYIGLGLLVTLVVFGNELLGFLLVIVLAASAVVLVKYCPRYAPEFLIKWVGSDTNFSRHLRSSQNTAPAPQQHPGSFESQQFQGYNHPGSYLQQPYQGGPAYIDPGRRNIPPNM
jgi:hypothetical protein